MQGGNLAKDITNTEDTDGPQGTKGITKAESTEGMLVVNLVKGIINRGYRWASGVELARDITNREDTDGPQGWNWPETSPTEDTDGPQGWNWTKASPTERIQMDLTFLFAVSTLTGHAFGELLKIHGHNACK